MTSVNQSPINLANRASQPNTARHRLDQTLSSPDDKHLFHGTALMTLTNQSLIHTSQSNTARPRLILTLSSPNDIHLFRGTALMTSASQPPINLANM